MPAPPCDADDLVREVYAPGLRGSLQPELLGAARRHGFIPYVIEPDAGALAAELAARRPVLVLQNLGVDRVPVWHYAVVVGLAGDEVILRSGTEERRLEHSTRFLRSWERGSNWAFVALPARRAARDGHGRRPTSARSPARSRCSMRRRPNEAIAPRSSVGRPTSSCCSRPPASGTPPRDLAGATALYRQLLAAAPQHAAARNNLANVLAERGCRAAGVDGSTRGARRARRPPTSSADAVRDTVAELERAAAEAREPRRRSANDERRAGSRVRKRPAPS